ncbi:hypothetical protein [Paraburkholderia humisilvae]|nr:hypothetical protein [Paraburkholderia humisilvae]
MNSVIAPPETLAFIDFLAERFGDPLYCYAAPTARTTATAAARRAH